MDAPNLLPREKKFLSDTTRVVEEHLAEHDFNVSMLCRYLGKSRVTAYRHLKKILNQSASAFIREKRLNQAAALLKEGSDNILEAARLSGFYYPSYFTKCFRKQFGMSPSEYIRQQVHSGRPNPAE